jgi:toxin ParE1/3/4
MIEIRWREDAEDDLVEIWRFIAAENAAAADRHIERTRIATRRLAHFPDSGHSRDDLPAGCRVINVRSYLIVYRLTIDIVEILAVQHGARSFGHLQARL